MKFLSVVVFLLISTLVQLSWAESVMPMKLEVSGFECAEKVVGLIPLLGRGSNFPAFVVNDISRELIRQDSSSILLSVNCLEPVQATLDYNDADSESGRKSLKDISVTFPVQVNVDVGAQILTMKVSQNYSVSDLGRPDVTRVIQNFIVDKSTVVYKTK